MNRVDPEYRFRVFGDRYVQIDHNGFLVAAYHHARERLGRIGVDS